MPHQSFYKKKLLIPSWRLQTAKLSSNPLSEYPSNNLMSHRPRKLAGGRDLIHLRHVWCILNGVSYLKAFHPGCYRQENRLLHSQYVTGQNHIINIHLRRVISLCRKSTLYSSVSAVRRPQITPANPVEAFWESFTVAIIKFHQTTRSNARYIAIKQYLRKTYIIAARAVHVITALPRPRLASLEIAT